MRCWRTRRSARAGCWRWGCAGWCPASARWTAPGSRCALPSSIPTTARWKTWRVFRRALDLTAEALTPKLLWLKRSEPRVYAAARSVLSAHNYVVYRLTGRMCVDYDTASIFGGIFDPQTKTWDRGVLAELGLPVDLWPDLLPATAAAGAVSAAAARLTGCWRGRRFWQAQETPSPAS